ncbi:MAG TPA: mechanosensitive ion channel family protein [Thermoanaerobaculia bacterium]|nr:mechanosensitive ion channel family protein [Thermoanaerobaculia bacterium]
MQLLTTFSTGSEQVRIGVAFLLIAGVVALFMRTERRHVLRVVLVYLLSLLVRFAAVLSTSGGMPALSKTLTFLALLFEWIALLNLGALLFFSVLLKIVRLEAPRILRELTVAASYIVLLIYLFSINHVDISGIIATSAVLTAVIGLSLQDILSNVMGGLALQMDRSIKVGDWVRYGEIAGIVREITWRHTAVESRNGDRFVIPNNLVMKNTVMLQGRRFDGTNKQRRWIYFNIDYRFSPSAIIEAVNESLRRQPIQGVAVEPEPHVLMFDFKESWAQYAVRYWLTDIVNDDRTDSEIRTRIYFALKRIGVPLSIPSSTLFMQRDRGERVRVAELERMQRLRDIELVAIFRGLTAEERQKVAQTLIYTPFVAGETIIMQGHAVHHLYILTSGTVEVRVSIDGGPSSAVRKLEAPDFFGEMGMLTGEPRRATVVALTNVECWRLDKEGLQEILTARPPIATEISHILASRDVELAGVREGLSEDAKKARLASAHKSLLTRIESFFGL